MKYCEVLAVTSTYWKPGEDYVARLVEALEDKLLEGDIVVISEKAISTATGNIVDESLIEAGWTAKLLARLWMRHVWARILGPICHLRRSTISRLRNYPVEEGSAHKQLALQHSGFLQALMHGSEGGVDGSNLPYSYVALPLRSANRIAEETFSAARTRLKRDFVIMIVDTDKTYSWRSFHFTPRPRPIEGVKSVGGVIAYCAGRLFKLKKRATPLAITGPRINVEEALEMAEMANRARGFGAGRTVWDMANTFGVSLTAVSWEMLDKIQHKPVVIVRLHG